MQRIVCPERDDWRTTAELIGFDFHTLNGERYWDERAYYAFTLDEIERRIEAPTGEIDAMCLELVGRAMSDEKYLRRLKLPEAFCRCCPRAGTATMPASTAASTSAMTAGARRNFWSTTRIRRPRSSKRRSFSGRGSNRRSSATSSRSAPTSSIRSTNA